jgi:hypothetical protein
VKWTQESVTEFIELHTRKEIICDPMNFNKIKKQDIREELVKEMNRPVDECENKMQNLMSSLRREKMKKCSGTGKGE